MNQYKIDIIISFLGSIVSFLIGKIDISIMILASFMIFDYLTGVIKAIKNKQLNSKIGFEGLLKKICIFIILIVANLLDLLLGNDNLMFRSIVIYFYISNEGISILENLCEMNVPIPEKIKEILLSIKESE